RRSSALPLPWVREAPPGCGVPAAGVAPFAVGAVFAGFAGVAVADPGVPAGEAGFVVEPGPVEPGAAGVGEEPGAEVSTPGFTSSGRGRFCERELAPLSAGVREVSTAGSTSCGRGVSRDDGVAGGAAV